MRDGRRDQNGVPHAIPYGRRLSSEELGKSAPIVKLRRLCHNPVMRSAFSNRRQDSNDSPEPVTHKRDEVRVAEERIEWRRSPDRKALNREGIAILVVAALAVYIAMWRVAPWLAKQIDGCCTYGIDEFSWMQAYFFASIFLIVFSFALYRFWRQRSSLYRGLFRDRRLVEAERSALQRAEAQQGEPSSDSPTLESLWSLTQRRLDYYHDLATTQAETSFARAQTAMIIGFVLVLALAWFGTTAKSGSGSIVAGTLSGIVGAATAYIAGTFIRTQENASSHLKSYFLQPLEFSRFLAAERIAMKMQGPARDQTLSSVAIAVAGGRDGNLQSEPTNNS
jgi:hypothetical protein